MNIYEVNIKDVTAIVAAESIDKAIGCFVDEFCENGHYLNYCDLCYVRQLACEEQAECGLSDGPKHLIVDTSAFADWLENEGYEVKYVGKKD